MDLHEIVMKLIGPVRAVGETREDERRLVNIGVLTELIDRLMDDVSDAARDSTREEASMKAIGKHAERFLRAVKEA